MDIKTLTALGMQLRGNLELISEEIGYENQPPSMKVFRNSVYRILLMLERDAGVPPGSFGSSGG